MSAIRKAQLCFRELLLLFIIFLCMSEYAKGNFDSCICWILIAIYLQLIKIVEKLNRGKIDGM